MDTSEPNLNESNDEGSKIFDFLRQRDILSSSMERVVGNFALKWGISKFRAVLETHMIDEGPLADLLADKLGYPCLTRVKILKVSKEILALIPFDRALELMVFPFELSELGRLHVVLADPSRPDIIRELEVLTGKTIEPFVGEHGDIIAAIQRHYPLTLQMPSLLSVVLNSKGVTP